MILAAALIVVVTGALPAVPEKPRILVLDPRNDGVPPATMQQLRDGLVAALLKAAPQMDVLAADELRNTLGNEDKAELLACTAENCAGAVAQATQSEYVVVGDVGFLEGELRAHLSLIDPSGVLSTFELTSVDAGACSKAAKRLVKPLPGAPPAGPPLVLIGGLTAGAGVVATGVGLGLGAYEGTQTSSGHEQLSTIGYGVAAVGGLLLVVGGVVAGIGLAAD